MKRGLSAHATTARSCRSGEGQAGEVGLALARERAQERLQAPGLCPVRLHEPLHGHQRLGARVLAQRRSASSRRAISASSRTAWSAHRCIRVDDRTRASSRSIQSSRSSAPSAKNSRATSSIERLGRRRDGDHVGRVDELGLERVGARDPRRDALAEHPPDRLLTTAPPLVGAQLPEHGAEPLEAVAAGRDRLLHRRALAPTSGTSGRSPRRARRRRRAARPARSARRPRAARRTPTARSRR